VRDGFGRCEGGRFDDCRGELSVDRKCSLASAFPRDKSQKNMGWTYVPNAAVTGSAFSGYMLYASGLAVVSAPSS
jgi:hypothetical protein